MWQKSVILGAFLAGLVYFVGWYQQLATTRMLIIRSLVTGTGTIIMVLLARKAIDVLTTSGKHVEAPLNDLNLGDFLEDDEPSPAEETTDSSAEKSADDSATIESSSAGGENLDDDDLQEALEEEVEKGNEEGVEQIADLISDSMNEG